MGKLGSAILKRVCKGKRGGSGVVRLYMPWRVLKEIAGELV
jgi:hypothetical protein